MTNFFTFIAHTWKLQLKTKQRQTGMITSYQESRSHFFILSLSILAQTIKESGMYYKLQLVGQLQHLHQDKKSFVM